MTKLNPENTSGVPVVCEVCGTVKEKPTESLAEQVVTSHDDLRHNSNRTAKVISEPTEVDTAKAPDQQRFTRKLINLVRED